MSTSRQGNTSSSLQMVAAALALFIALLATPVEADATIMRYADVDRLVEISDVIVHATVSQRQIVLDDERRPWTETTVEIHHSFRGPEQDELVFHQWGANDGPRTGRIAGDPRLDAGEEVILFLRRDTARDGLSLAALAQAVYYVEKRDSRRIVRRDLSELAMVVPGDKSSRHIHYDEPPHAWTIFIHTLESLLEGRKK